MRILKFIGVFVGTLLIVFFLSFGFNLDALTTLFQNSEDLQEGQEWVSRATSLKGLTGYIGSNPQHASVVSRSVENPDTTIAYQSDTPRTMGTLSNFFLVTTYARLVEEGTISAEELISLEKTDRYLLPYIDASNHEDAKTVLSNSGHINKQNEVPLNQLVKHAIIYNDLAISDYLYYQLGPEQIHRTMKMLDLQHTEGPLPFSGLYITLHPGLHERSFKTHFSVLKKLSNSAFRDSVYTATDRFVTDNRFHEKVRDTFSSEQGLGVGFKERRELLHFFPKSTAGELSDLMVRVEQDSLISQPVSQRVKRIMSWPYQEQKLNSDFKYYGAIYDNRLGLLNGIDYGASIYSEEPFGQAVFFDSLQVAFWFHMSSNLMHQDYQQRLMWDPALRTATQQEINN